MFRDSQRKQEGGRRLVPGLFHMVAEALRMAHLNSAPEDPIQYSCVDVGSLLGPLSWLILYQFTIQVHCGNILDAFAWPPSVSVVKIFFFSCAILKT